MKFENIQYADDAMEIISNTAKISLILFLTVKNPFQPNFGEEVVFLYALLNIDMVNELGFTKLNCQNKPFASPKERYDAQYSDIISLMNK